MYIPNIHKSRNKHKYCLLSLQSCECNWFCLQISIHVETIAGAQASTPTVSHKWMQKDPLTFVRISVFVPVAPLIRIVKVKEKSCKKEKVKFNLLCYISTIFQQNSCHYAWPFCSPVAIYSTSPTNSSYVSETIVVVKSQSSLFNICSIEFKLKQKKLLHISGSNKKDHWLGSNGPNANKKKDKIHHSLIITLLYIYIYINNIL